ncbi:SigE family RNA polymerase sigma factor [Nocardioides sp.]|uniref:SigE family RNA polymerase sigma factor n=1 Tax=Nocardioides sp. TaxID=35761 RepID=UPI0025FB5F64|nr:SigE family RNA polymerase sigma factor [Nocardioides sp.]
MARSTGGQIDGEFDEFAAAAWPRLRRSAYLLTGDHHLAEDLTQTALVRTYANWRRVRRADALAYARKILVNANIDRLRRRRMLEVGDGDHGTDLGQVAGRPDERADERDELVRLLRTLTDRERRVVVLRHYFDLSEREVADELAIATGTVKSTLARALSKLRVSTDSIQEVVGQ